MSSSVIIEITDSEVEAPVPVLWSEVPRVGDFIDIDGTSYEVWRVEWFRGEEKYCPVATVRVRLEKQETTDDE